jgi:hypothetical protein
MTIRLGALNFKNGILSIWVKNYFLYRFYFILLLLLFLLRSWRQTKLIISIRNSKFKDNKKYFISSFNFHLVMALEISYDRLDFYEQ